MNKWHLRYFDLAHHVARWSKDPSTQVGAVVVGSDKRQIALGYNGFPPGVEDTPSRYAVKETKYAFTQHAERNALDNAQFDLRGGTLVTTMYPCVECAKSIAAKGIKCVVTPLPPDPIAEASWRDTIKWSEIVFEECGVEVVFIDSYAAPREAFIPRDVLGPPREVFDPRDVLGPEDGTILNPEGKVAGHFWENSKKLR